MVSIEIIFLGLCLTSLISLTLLVLIMNRQKVALSQMKSMQESKYSTKVLEPQSAIDNALDEINNFKLRASNPSNTTTTIKRVVCESIEIEPINESNDNSFILIINMSVTACFAVI